MKFKLFYLLLCCMPVVIVTAQTKHALIFAIGNYPKAGGWPQISSIRDIFYIKATLIKQGFKENDIKTVTDANATPKGIADALSGLINEVKPDDIVVIHFSSHGEQVEDDNGDETDGKDETIVTYNAYAPRSRSDPEFKKHQAEYFRDDQFGSYINKLRARLGKKGDVVVFMDLCHSGSGTRGIAKVRGGQPPLVSDNFDQNKFNHPDDNGVFKENNTSNENDSALATYVVISAARAEELNYEITDNKIGMGSLTYAISKAFEKLDAGTTYRSLFAKIQSVIQQKVPNQQHPVLEGNGIDRELFGGRFVQQKPYVEIEKIEGRRTTIRAGKLSGLDAGAKIEVYPSGTKDPAKTAALASGIVIKADNYTAAANLDKDAQIRQTTDAWIFVSEPVYKMEPVGISLQSGTTRSLQFSFSESEAVNMKNTLKDLPGIQFEGEPDLILMKGETEDSIKIASNGYLFKTIKNMGSNPEQLREEIRNYIQYKFLQGIEIKDANTNVEVILVPFINGIADTTKINTKIINGIYSYKEGDQFVLWIKNPGKLPVYFNVLDMQPDGIINPAFPLKRKEIYPRDLKIEEGSSRIFDRYVIHVSPPFGTEIFKIFVSTTEIDMEAIANTKENTTRGNFTFLEKLVKNSYDAASRGASPQNISNSEGSTYNLLFQISPVK